MAPQKYTISYNKPGTRPPVFVAGTFSDPEWQPHEMASTVETSGEHKFKKDISVEEGTEVQYKFRLGSGDWWVTDETVETVPDSQGNVNNVVLIGPTALTVEATEDVEEQDDAPPMFSYECLGSHDVSPSAQASNPLTNGHAIDSNERLPSPVISIQNANKGHEDANIDFDDPLLEPFPHENRASILAAIQKIGTSIDEDRSIPRGSPPSPIVSPASRLSLSAEPEPHAQRLSAPRATLGSMHSDRSHGSLGSIQETAEDPQDDHQQNDSAVMDDKPVVVAQNDNPAQPIVRLEAYPDEDEGVSLRSGSSSSDEVTKTNHVRKRKTGESSDNRPASSASVRSIHEAGKQGNWLQSFLRALFVDYIGGFFSNLLFKNQRKA